MSLELLEQEYRLNKDGTVKDERRPGAYTSSRLTPFEASPLSDSVSECHGPKAEDALFNDKNPFYGLIREKPEHRGIIELKASGYTNKEIAELSGYTAVAVSNIVRQPWARKRIVEAIRKHNEEDEVEMLLRANAANAVRCLIDNFQNSDARPQERTAAAVAFLDRRFGRPNQPITHSGSIDLNTLKDDELAAIACTGGTATSPS